VINQTDRYVNKPTGVLIITDRQKPQTVRHSNRQTNKYTDIQSNRQTDKKIKAEMIKQTCDLFTVIDKF
jgi:hypothetical protein